MTMHEIDAADVECGPLAAVASPPAPKPEKKDRWTLLEVLRWTTGRFQERALATPRLDAEVLIAAALNVPRVQLYVQFERPLETGELTTIRDHVRRRQAGESVAYIVGHKEFFGLELAVDKRVLVPRPDTETLVDEALARWRERGTVTSPVRVADVGTGSGAIVVALGRHMAGAALFAVDVSDDALEVARANAAHHGVSVTFLAGDLVSPLAAYAPFDLLVSNPPYIPSGDIAALPAEVRAEPLVALDGGADGLDLVRRLVSEASAVLAPAGALALEIGAGQAERVAALFTAAGLVDIRLRRDLGSIDRVVSGVRP